MARGGEVPEFVAYLVELIGPVRAVRPRAMFGGWSLFAGDTMIAIVSDDRLYLRADPATQAAFVAAGGEPFTYRSRGRTVSLRYYAVPATALDDPEAMRPWAELALRAEPVRGRRRRRAG